jgi:alginate O-acetyltransferase complex protein AlgI
LRDYVYIPLGGNRMTTAAGVYRNLLITMLLGGLWHGGAVALSCCGAWRTLLPGARALASAGPCQSGGHVQPAGGGSRAAVVFHCVVFTWLLVPRAQQRSPRAPS